MSSWDVSNKSGGAGAAGNAVHAYREDIRIAADQIGTGDATYYVDVFWRMWPPVNGCKLGTLASGTAASFNARVAQGLHRSLEDPEEMLLDDDGSGAPSFLESFWGESVDVAPSDRPGWQQPNRIK